MVYPYRVNVRFAPSILFFFHSTVFWWSEISGHHLTESCVTKEELQCVDTLQLEAVCG
jgi:hypothetical protein